MSEQDKHLVIGMYVRLFMVKKSPLGLGLLQKDKFIKMAPKPLLLLTVRITGHLLLFDEVPEAEHFVSALFGRIFEIFEK